MDTAADTRLLVKNLPKHITEARLKQVFGKMGTLTDVKIARKKSGASRMFGFIGYQTPEAAKKAQQFFHKSFLDTSKLDVSFAIAYGSDALPRPWSKYSKGSSAYTKSHPEDQKKEKGEKVVGPKQSTEASLDDIFGNKKRAREGDNEEEQDRKKPKLDGEAQEDQHKFKEYMALMKKKNKFWANDDIIPENLMEAPKPKQKKKSEDQESETDDSDEYMDYPQDTMMPEEESSEAEKDEILNDEGVSDLDWLKSRASNTSSIFGEAQQGSNEGSSESEDEEMINGDGQSGSTSSSDEEQTNKNTTKSKKENKTKNIIVEDKKGGNSGSSSSGDDDSNEKKTIK